jgi:hypothetical protein
MSPVAALETVKIVGSEVVPMDSLDFAYDAEQDACAGTR